MSTRSKHTVRRRSRRPAPAKGGEGLLFRTISEHIHDLVIVADKNGRVQYRSPSYLRISRASAHRWSDTIGSGVHPEDLARLTDAFDETLRTGTPRHVDLRFQLKDGSVRFLASTLSAVGSGESPFILIVSQDITDRQEAEKSQRLLAYALSCTKDCFCLTDLQNNFLFVNPAFCETYGYSEEELLGSNISMIRTDDTPPEVVADILPQTLRGGWYGELVNRKKDGSKLRVELWTSVVRNEENEPMALVGVARDITGRKNAEEEVALLHTISLNMNEAPDAQTALLAAVRRICAFTGWTMGQAWLMDAGTSKLLCVGGEFKPLPLLEQFHKLSRSTPLVEGRGLPGVVWKRRAPVWVDNLARFGDLPFSDVLLPSGCCSAVGIPILAHGEVVAVAEFYSVPPIVPEQYLKDLVSTLGLQLGSVVQRKLAEEALQRSNSLLSSTLESTGDGILVVDAAGKVVTFNQRFASMWQIPQALLESRDDTKLIHFVVDQLRDPDRFLDKILELYSNPESESFDIITFKDGKVFERYSMPQFINGKSSGRVWSFHDITELKAIEQKLTEEESKYRLLFTSNPEAIWVYDVETLRFLAVNDAAAARYGYSKEEFLRMSLPELLHSPKQDWPGSSAGPKGAALERPVLVQLKGKDRSVIDVEFLSHPIEFEGRQARIVIAKDVTMRRRAEKVQAAVYRIAQAGERAKTLEDLFAELHEIISTVMPADNFYIALVDQSEETLSFPYFVDEVEPPPPPQKLGRGLTEYILRTGESLLVDSARDQELQRLGEVEMVGASSPIWLGVPLKVEQKSIGVMTVQHYRDASAYGKPEQQILEFVSSQIARAIDKKRAEQALLDSEQKYRTLFEDSKDGIFISTPEGRLIDVNPAGVRLFGFNSKEEMIRSDIVRDLYVSAADREQFRKTLLSQGFVVDFEFEIRTRTGERKSVLESASTITDDQKNIIGVRGFVRDITERKRLEEKLRHAHKMESIGTLAGGVAHDFNNLLGIILGYASLMEGDRHDPEKTRQNVHTIKKAVERGAMLVRQLLTFARKSDTQFEPLNVNDTVRELEKMLIETFPKTINIVTHLHPSLPLIIADSGQIHQALLNLCVNARDAIIDGPGSGSGTVRIATSFVDARQLREKHPESTANEYLLVTVGDTGIGMNEETRRRIFEPFFTTKGLGRGTGLGLSVVYGVVHNHRGYIEVASSEGEGTTFSLYFPVQPAEADVKEEGPAPEETAAGGSETILVVEDEEMLRDLVQALLVDRGYTVLTAKDGQEGIEIFRKHADSIGCILTDMGLPRLGGWEMFLKMKEMRPKVKAILASGYCDPKLKAEMLKEGARDFIQKPYVSEVVLHRIREILDED